MPDPAHQEQMMEYRVLAEQIQQVQQHLSALEQHVQQLQSVQHALTQLSTMSTPRETFIPVGAGIFFNGSIHNTQEVLLNVGSNICVKKSVPDALQTIDKQLMEVQGVMDHFEQEMQKGMQRVEELKQELSHEH